MMVCGNVSVAHAEQANSHVSACPTRGTIWSVICESDCSVTCDAASDGGVQNLQDCIDCERMPAEAE
jgi:hypothetical protein